jgi:hypothetical protein
MEGNGRRVRFILDQREADLVDAVAKADARQDDS